MVKQYPHRLTFKSLPGPATRDADGIHIPGTPGQQVEHLCRAEVATGGNRGNVVKSEDGQELDLGWVVYLPLPCPEIPINTAVMIYEGEALLTSSQAKRFNRGQLNARLWL